MVCLLAESLKRGLNTLCGLDMHGELAFRPWLSGPRSSLITLVSYTLCHSVILTLVTCFVRRTLKGWESEVSAATLSPLYILLYAAVCSMLHIMYTVIPLYDATVVYVHSVLGVNCCYCMYVYYCNRQCMQYITTVCSHVEQHKIVPLCPYMLTPDVQDAPGCILCIITLLVYVMQHKSAPIHAHTGCAGCSGGLILKCQQRQACHRASSIWRWERCI